VGIPKIYWCGVEGERTIMIIELLGFNLEKLFNTCNRKFSLKCAVMIIAQIVYKFFIK